MNYEELELTWNFELEIYYTRFIYRILFSIALMNPEFELSYDIYSAAGENVVIFMLFVIMLQYLS